MHDHPEKLILLLFLFLMACQPDHKKSALNENGPEVGNSQDIHSYAQPDQAVIRHVDLDLSVDFDQKVLSGTATYAIEVKPGATAIILDTRDLEIREVRVDGQVAAFQLGDSKPFMGQALTIPVTRDAKQVRIAYATRPGGADALQWLSPEQTAGKVSPYLFTQGQAILTRTWIPIQDSPGIRLTYSATIRVPAGLIAVMSATNPTEKNPEGIYSFDMPQPIPAYLIALAVGDLAFRSLGPRTGVYTEPAMISACANEFADLEKMVMAAEALYGPYQWGRYDVIVLPPSFPFGGMENPRLTFATPTIIAGDKSLIALVAHELAHSWSGNLVTNATWNDFWLNEGFTVYFELRIMEALYGKSYSDMLTALGHQSLLETVADLAPDDTHLFLNLEGRNPDDGMNDIAYEKGAHFLMLLEQSVGRERFDTFLKNYFNAHQFTSVSTAEFAAYLKSYLLEPNHLEINIDEWLYGPGLPRNCPVVRPERFVKVDTAVTEFLAGKNAGDLATGEWSTHEWLHFIRALDGKADVGQLKNLDARFHFAASTNSEIQAAWFLVAIKAGYGRDLLPEIEKFLTHVGRRKFLTPLYSALIDNGLKPEAQNIFVLARPNYHSVAYNTINDLLHAPK